MAGLASPKARFASHLVLLCVVVGIALLGRALSAYTLTERARAVPTEMVVAPVDGGDLPPAVWREAYPPISQGGPRVAAPDEVQSDGHGLVDGPATERRPLQVVRYRVAKGDTVSKIAAKFEVSPETIIWANKLDDAPDRLVIGQELVFPPLSGVLHEVGFGETLASVAQRYAVEVAAIAAANLLDAAGTLVVGQQLIVPGGRMPSRAVAARTGVSSRGGERSRAMMPGATEERPAATPPPVPPADGETSANEAYRQSASSRGGEMAPATTAQVITAIDPNPAHWEFIQAAIGPAQESQRQTGVPASVTIGQAIHESAWGTSRLSRDGNNYFGIKAAGQPGPRGVIRMGTWEHINGANVTVIDGFRAYNNMAESFLDHGRFLTENKRYAAAMAKTDDPRAFIRLVAQGGYATDPNYTRKVLAYMDRYDLYQYDLN